MVNDINGISTINIRPPQEYAKYEYEVEIDGKKQMACVEKAPNGRVTIKVGDGKDVKVINTDVEGLMEFNKNYRPKDILYSSKPEEKPREQKEVYSGKLAQIMRNIAIASMAIGAKANQDLQDLANQQIILDQNNQMQNQMIQQQIQQQVMQDNFTAMQMSTPGMGII